MVKSCTPSSFRLLAKPRRNACQPRHWTRSERRRYSWSASWCFALALPQCSQALSTGSIWRLKRLCKSSGVPREGGKHHTSGRRPESKPIEVEQLTDRLNHRHSVLACLRFRIASFAVDDG